MSGLNQQETQQARKETVKALSCFKITDQQMQSGLSTPEK